MVSDFAIKGLCYRGGQDLPENLYRYGFGEMYGAPERPPERETDICLAWIDLWTAPRVSINKSHGSYFLKHVIERWSGEYIPNGAFIAAAIESGCDYIRRGPNARFNLSYKPAMSNKKASGWSR